MFGAGRTAVGISPLNGYNSMCDSDPVGLAAWLAKALDPFSLSHLHVMRADLLGASHGEVLAAVRANYSGKLVANMGCTREEADEAISTGAVDAVAFGTAFIANPDLPGRFSRNAPLNAPDPATFYTPGPAGYTDYPALAR